jgi:hypothetical protein
MRWCGILAARILPYGNFSSIVPGALRLALE